MESSRPAQDEWVDPLLGTVVSDRYHIESKLGEGGMGQVYLAEHSAIGKRVALKRLSPEFASNTMVVERFMREAKAATMAGNEHVVEVFDMGRLPDGSPYIVMELLEGMELRDLMEQNGPMSIGRAVNIIRQTCDALTPVHAKGIVHRDLKPENLFMTKRLRGEDFVKVLDFGISKLTEKGGGDVPKLTSTGMSIGTPHYMSPEQAQGLDSVDPRTDQYALGVILFELLSHQLPFDGQTYAMLIVDIVTKDAPSIRTMRADIPEGLAQILDRCLSKSPSARYADVQELSQALAEFEGMTTTPEPTGSRPSGTADEMPVSGTRPSTRSPARPVDSNATVQLGKAQQKKTKGGPVTQPHGSVAPEAHSSVQPPGSPPSSSAPSPSTGEAAAPRGLQSNKTLWVGGAALALVGVVLIGAVAMLSDPPEETPDEAPVDAPVAPVAPPLAAPPAVEPQGEPEVTTVEVRILAAPAHAQIFIGETEYPNPLTIPLERSTTPVRLRIDAEGHEAHERLLVLTQDHDIVHTLEQSASPRRPNGPRPNMREPSGSTEMTTAMAPAMEQSTMGMGDGFRDDF